MPADLILRHGVVHTVDAARRTLDGVAIAAGRIAAVGSARELDSLRGPSTRVVDLAGAMVLPGFQDAHCHLGMSGYATTLCDLEGSRDAGEHLRRIGEYRAAHPDREWIVGGGWSMSDLPGGIPTAVALDAVVPDRPAVLPNRDGHGVWVNTRALELAGVTAATPDPPGGRIERDSHGEPLGTLQEQAMHLVLDRAPLPPTPSGLPASGPARPTTTGSGSRPARTRPSIPIGRPRTSSSPARTSSPCGCAGRCRGIPNAARTSSRSWSIAAAAGRSAGSRAATSSSSTTAWSRTAPRRCSTRTWTGRGGRPRNTGSTSTRSPTSNASCACATGMGSGCTSTRSATGLCASRSTCSRRPCARTDAATPATSLRTSSSPTPTICPASARWA